MARNSGAVADPERGLLYTDVVSSPSALICPSEVNMDADSYVVIRSLFELLAYHRYPLAFATFCIGMRVLYFAAIIPR